MSEIKVAIEKAKGFDKYLKKHIHKDKILFSCEQFLSSFKFTKKSPNSVILYQSELYQIWKFRIPHPEANKGKSSGFRLFVYFLEKEKKFILYKIFLKKDIEKDGNIDEKIKEEIKKLLNE